jgi:uncharacterized protein (DUF362 family)
VVGSSKVVTIQRDDSIDKKGLSLGESQIGVVQRMVDALLTELAGGASNPWPVIVPGINNCTRVGLKVNCLNPSFPTSPAIVRAVVKSLIANVHHECGGNIIVWDRSYTDELKAVGKYDQYLRELGASVFIRGTANGPQAPGYSEASFGTFEGSSPRLSRILLEQTDVTINLPVLKTHGQSGITAALKNIYGIIDNPESFHKPKLNTALPALFAIPAIRNSIKLTIVDGLRAVINRNTADPPDSQPGRIFGSLDPLATDFYARDLVNDLRDARKFGPITPEADLAWLDNAYNLGLGAKTYDLVTVSLGDDVGDGGIPDDAAPDTASS